MQQDKKAGKWHARRLADDEHFPHPKEDTVAAAAAAAAANFAVDFNSLYAALEDDLSSESQAHASIDLDASDVGVHTLLELLAQRDLAEQMDDIERMEREKEEELDVGTVGQPSPVSHTCQEMRLDRTPTLIRVLYMGAASDKDKRLFFKKLSEGLSEIFHRDGRCDEGEGQGGRSTSSSNSSSSPSSSSSSLSSAASSSMVGTRPGTFKERKHHLTLISLMPEETEPDIVETCQDYGVSIIEADFTWAMDIGNDLIMRYVWHQYIRACQDPPTWIPPTLSRQAAQSTLLDLENVVYTETTPNGIDLCVYFYSDHLPDDLQSQQHDVRQDMMTLWQLKRLGIPILPILSMYHKPRHRLQERMVERQAALADLFAQYKIQGIDVSNLDVGQIPSFYKRKRSHLNDPLIEQYLGKEWAQSSAVHPVPSQFLTVDQFVAIDRKNVFDLLNTSRQQAAARNKAHAQQPLPEQDVQSSTHSSLASILGSVQALPARHLESQHDVHRRFPRFLFVSLLTLVFALAVLLFCGWHRPSHPWTASFHVAQEDTRSLGFSLEVRNPEGVLAWLPEHTVPAIKISQSQATFFMERSTVGRAGIYHFTLPTDIYYCVSSTDAAALQPIEATVDVLANIVAIQGSPIYFTRPPCPRPSLTTMAATERKERVVNNTQPYADQHHIGAIPTSPTPTDAARTTATTKEPPAHKWDHVLDIYRKAAYLIWSWESIMNLEFIEE